MSKKSTPPKGKDVAEQPASGGRRPSAWLLLGDVIEAPGPYDVVRAHNSELWLVVDAHRDAILWTEQQLAADAAAEALNGMARLKALPPPHSGSVRRKLKSWSGEWFALGSRGIHPSTAAMMERLGLAEKRPCPHGLSVSRDYDWRLTERGKIERDRNDA